MKTWLAAFCYVAMTVLFWAAMRFDSEAVMAWLELDQARINEAFKRLEK